MFKLKMNFFCDGNKFSGLGIVSSSNRHWFLFMCVCMSALKYQQKSTVSVQKRDLVLFWSRSVGTFELTNTLKPIWFTFTRAVIRTLVQLICFHPEHCISTHLIPFNRQISFSLFVANFNLCILFVNCCR